MNIISYNFEQVLKNRLKSKINCITDELVHSLLKNIAFNNTDDNNYLNMISTINHYTIEIIKEVLLDVIQEFDKQYRNSAERKREYYVNKSNLARTIITIFGEITFSRTYYVSKITGEYYAFIDDLLGIPKGDHYDQIVKGLTVKEVFNSNQAQAGRIIGERMCEVNKLANDNLQMFHIPRQSVNNWLKVWKEVNVIYEKNPKTPKFIYIMVDEKYIGSQDLKKDIVGKSFVVFEGVKQVCKGRRELINRKIFTFYSDNPWIEFIDKLCEIYDYDEIEDFYVLSDGGNWITAGLSELKLESFQKVTHLLCIFHFKQAINHITTNKEERKEIFNSFINDKRKVFKNKLNKFLELYPTRKENISKKIKYILNHYKGAKHMISSSVGSSMESHISHYIASTFASRPKGYSSKNIAKYFMLNDYKNNGLNLFNLYLQTYDTKEDVVYYNESKNHINAFKNKKESLLPTVLPILQYSFSKTYETISNITNIDNEIRCK